MPPTLVLIRHAEALHNRTGDGSIRDPKLTPLGIRQSEALRQSLIQNLPKDIDVELIVASPMRRTLETTMIALDWLVEKGIRVKVDADWQEIYDKPCDTGSPLPDLKRPFPAFDFSTLDPVYPDKSSPQGKRYAHNKSAVLARAQIALDKLYHRPEQLIVVVSHSAFMRLAVSGTYYANADYRIFDFDDRQSDDEPYSLKEWEWTRSNGGGLGLSQKGQVELGSGDLPPDKGSAKVESS